MLTLSKRLDDEREAEKAKENHVELLEAGEDAAVSLHAPEQPLDLVPLFVKGAVVAPGIDTVGFGRNDGDHAEVEHQLPGFVAFVSAVHQHGQALRHRSKLAQQFAAFRRIVRIARRQGKSYRRPSIRGNQMNLGVPSAARLADGLRSVFLTPQFHPDAP